MNALIKRLIHEATAPVEKMSARLFKKAVLFFAVLSCLFISSIFLTIALFIFVQTLAGTTIAALATGSLYLGAAAICIMVASRESSRHTTSAPAASNRAAETPGDSPPQNLAFANNIDEVVAPVLDILRDAGFERERLALAAGTEIAKQLHPFSLVAFAIVAGFVLGRILKQRGGTP
jgi:hypothetical protein